MQDDETRWVLYDYDTQEMLPTTYPTYEAAVADVEPGLDVIVRPFLTGRVVPDQEETGD